MTEFHFYHFTILVLMALLSWILPRKLQLNSIALLGNIFVLWIAPAAAMSLLLSAIFILLITHYQKHNSIWIFIGIAYCTIQFLLLRYLHQNSASWGSVTILSTLGIAYFTCRDIHYLIESYKGNITNNLRYFWLYQSFLPSMVTGPINRYPDFIREIQRRSFNSHSISLAIERIIYGYAKVVIIGNYLINIKVGQQLEKIEANNTLLFNFLNALSDWAYLYAQFSGWSDIAIGFSLLMGIRINENFNYPLKAKNLIDFWQRWHISLSLWCKDYIFTPSLAITRNLFISIIASMVAMGVWHELSSFYILWGIYHALGITICRIFQKQTHPLIINMTQTTLWPLIAWTLTFSFIVSSSLVVNIIEQYF